MGKQLPISHFKCQQPISQLLIQFPGWKLQMLMANVVTDDWQTVRWHSMNSDEFFPCMEIQQVVKTYKWGENW